MAIPVIACRSVGKDGFIGKGRCLFSLISRLVVFFRFGSEEYFQLLDPLFGHVRAYKQASLAFGVVMCVKGDISIAEVDPCALRIHKQASVLGIRNNRQNFLVSQVEFLVRFLGCLACLTRQGKATQQARCD